MGNRENAVAPRITVSIVSHGQGRMLDPLLAQLREAAATLPMQVVVTLNLPEERATVKEMPGFSLTWIDNVTPTGFAENHNAAFAHCRAPYFCVLNPDVRLDARSLAPLLECVARRPGVVGPRVVAPGGSVEDSARYIPSPLRLLVRRLQKQRVADYSPDVPEQHVDWIAGMCMVFDCDTFRAVGGFDTRFRLYCEDIDICLRIHLRGRFVTWVQNGVVVHDAQRASHRNWNYLAWHVGSLVRLFSSGAYWRFRIGLRRASIQHG